MKYPRTWHLPDSPGGTNDDRRLTSLARFVGRPIVITEKMDGSNVALECRALYARSHAHPPGHSSFDELKAKHAAVKGRIPPSFQIFGEWLYARHSIHYLNLPSYLQLFAVRDGGLRTWLSWNAVTAWAASLGVPTVPVLRQLQAPTEAALRATIAELVAGLGDNSEGFVIRWEEEFPEAQFQHAVGKWVRKDHVTSDEHWRNQAIVRNRLAKEKA